MAGAALAARLPDIVVETAGTLTVDGQPMSWRTRTALESVGLAFPSHRSRQASLRDLDQATLIIGLAPEHVLWVRRNHEQAAARTATLKRLCRDLPADERPLVERVAALDLGAIDLEPWEEVVDPGGGEVDVFVACAHEIYDLIERLATLLPGVSSN
ncbi:MAG: protein arginine phosphatase [Acidimicrobiaceae bacterium]|jgi:protein-tyrosine-phosphatase